MAEVRGCAWEGRHGMTWRSNSRCMAQQLEQLEVHTASSSASSTLSSRSFPLTSSLTSWLTLSRSFPDAELLPPGNPRNELPEIHYTALLLGDSPSHKGGGGGGVRGGVAGGEVGQQQLQNLPSCMSTQFLSNPLLTLSTPPRFGCTFQPQQDIGWRCVCVTPKFMQRKYTRSWQDACTWRGHRMALSTVSLTTSAPFLLPKCTRSCDLICVYLNRKILCLLQRVLALSLALCHSREIIQTYK